MSPGGVILTFGLMAGPAAGVPASDGHRCVRLNKALATGAVLTPRDFEPASCDGVMADNAIGYDLQAGAARALRDLSEGEVARSIPSFAAPAVRAGQRLYVRAQVGPVLVEREVEALQSAQAGQRLFVRTREGGVLSALLQEPRP